jgi:hypothetical protein
MIRTKLNWNYRFLSSLRDFIIARVPGKTETIITNTETKEYIIEFISWENDPPINIQLEPEAFEFSCARNESLKFVAKCDSKFSWIMRLDGQNIGGQLYPETKGKYEVMVYLNDKLIF